MLESAKFIIEKTINPAKELYRTTKDLDESILSLNEKEKIEKIYNQTVASEIVLSRFKKTGDIYKYLLKSIDINSGETKEQMNKLNLIPFEDIMEKFESYYKSELDDVTSIYDLIIDDVYSTWDFIFLADVYRTQSPGILGVANPDNRIKAVIARGNFKEDKHTYNNEYLADDRSKIKYYLIRGNHKYNSYITEMKLNIYFFETIGTNQQLFKGIYELESYDTDNNYVILNRKILDSTPGDNFLKEIEVKKEYRDRFKQGSMSTNGSGGHSKTGQYKKEAGDRAELIVSNYLKLKNIENELLTSTDKLHHYDIKIKSGINLEVKNITNNKSFYLSESQIKEYRSNNTRLCFVDIKKNQHLIYISKPYEETKELKELIKDYLELKLYSIKKYNGRLRVDSVEMGIVKPDNQLIGDLYEDFTLINQLSRKQIIEILSND